jgi:peptide/nickel transport system substrate-binding protein
MKRAIVLIVFLLLAGVAAVGQSLAQSDTPKPGGTLRAGWSAEWVSLDPAVSSAYSSFAVLANVVEPLTSFDDNVKLIPWLAESWEQSADGLTWTFHLRKGVKFSNGREMTADDVKFSFDRILDPKIGSGWVNNVGGSDAKFAAVDPYTFTITTSTPNGILPITLAGSSQGVVAKESVGKDGQIVVPIGTGPFVISDVQGTTSMTLKKNPTYWQQGMPYLDEIDIKVIADETVRESALLGGEVDWILDPPPQDYQALKDNKDVVVDAKPLLQYSYIGVNTRKKPLDDVRVRQAISYALDRQQICEAGDFGLCTPIDGPTGPGSPWYFDYAPYKQDIEKAKALLTEAGYPDGFDLELMPTSAYPVTVRQAQVVQQQLAAIGIRATINAPEWAQWLELEGKGNYQTYVCGWLGLNDADNYYYLQHRTGQVFNFTGYSNPELDKLLDEGRSISDFDKRYAIYKQANKILVDDAPYIYFYAPLGVRAYKPYVKGFETRADALNVLWTVWLDK